MKIRRTLMFAITLVMALLGTGLATSMAHAENNDGVCITNGNGTCWRNGGAPTDLWARDISGDPTQQYQKDYIGTAASTPWIANCLIDLQQVNPPLYQAIENIGVWKFYDSGGYAVGAGYQGYMGEDHSGFSCYDAWMWGTSGELINVGQTDFWTNLDLLCAVPEYSQLYVNGNCSATWTSIHV